MNLTLTAQQLIRAGLDDEQQQAFLRDARAPVLAGPPTHELSGYRALSWALVQGQARLLEMLLKHGGMRADDIRAMLKWTVYYRCPDMTKLLLSCAPGPRELAEWALWMSSDQDLWWGNQHDNPEMFRVLLDYGAQTQHNGEHMLARTWKKQFYKSSLVLIEHRADYSIIDQLWGLSRERAIERVVALQIAKELVP